MRRGGFTLIEALVAVVILASAGTAALKLMVLSQSTLAAVEERERLLDGAREIEVGILTGELDKRGRKDGLRWETEEKEAEMFGEDFGRLDLEGLDFDRDGREGGVSETIRVKWREIRVSDEKGNGMTVYLESEEDEKKRLPAAQKSEADEGGSDENNE